MLACLKNLSFIGIVLESEPHKNMKTLTVTLAIVITSLLLPLSVTGTVFAGKVCGDKKDGAVTTSIDIGCKGVGNPIMDAFFAIIRFLSDGVGLVIIASIVYGGIQFTSSRGNPQDTAKAIERIRSAVIALLIFIFGYAFLNYLIPAGVLR